MKNLEKWNQLARVPVSHLKTIQFGALKGKSDINPQWRYKAMTEVYGECGKDWNHRLVNTEIVDGANGEVLIFVEVAVWVGDIASLDQKEFTGVGGDKIVVKDKNGLRSNDEAMKMAYTDALGTALKYVGVASEIYEGNFDGSKYADPTDATALAEQERYENMIADLMPSVTAIKDGIATGDLSTANEAWSELSDTEKELLWKAPTKGGKFTTREREIMKSTEFREAK